MIVAFVTHNRLEYTKRTLEALLESITRHNTIIVAVDNASSDGTQKYLRRMAIDHGIHALMSPENLYPGKACNKAWRYGLKVHPKAEYLVRVDNDCLMKTGWQLEVVECFKAMPFLGQLGLMNQEQSFPPGENKIVPHSEGGKTVNRWWGNIGGPNAIHRELWDAGLRYDEKPWHSDGGPTAQEDVKLSLAVKSRGYFFANMIPNFCTELSYGNTSDYPEYYRRTFTQRGHPEPPMTKNGEVLEEGRTPVGGHGMAKDHI